MKKAPEPTSLALPIPSDVGAVAVDVNIYKWHGMRVRSTPLAELPRVQELGVKWLVPEFWNRELQRHMTEHMERAPRLKRDLEDAAAWATDAQVASAGQLAQALAETRVQGAQRLLAEHFGPGKPVHLRTAWDSGPQVLEDYFAHRDPFEAQGPKRKEFPDAFALATLAAWAQKNDSRVLVVTRDEGCLRACAASEYLLGVNSLTEALAALRTADAGRKQVIETFEELLSRELRQENSELRRELDTQVARALNDVEVDISYAEDSGHDCEHEVTDVSIEQIKPIEYTDGHMELRVYTATMGELSFTCGLDLQVQARARFARVIGGNRNLRFSQAPEERARGTVSVQAIVTLQASGALSAQTLPTAKVRRVELEVTDTDIDFGFVESWVPTYEE